MKNELTMQEKRRQLQLMTHFGQRLGLVINPSDIYDNALWYAQRASFKYRQVGTSIGLGNRN